MPAGRPAGGGGCLPAGTGVRLPRTCGRLLRSLPRSTDGKLGRGCPQSTLGGRGRRERPGPPQDTPLWVGLYRLWGSCCTDESRGRPRSSGAGRGVMNHRVPRKRFYPACRAVLGACQVRAGAGSHPHAACGGKSLGALGRSRARRIPPTPEFSPPLSERCRCGYNNPEPS